MSQCRIIHELDNIEDFNSDNLCDSDEQYSEMGETPLLKKLNKN